MHTLLMTVLLSMSATATPDEAAPARTIVKPRDGVYENLRAPVEKVSAPPPASVRSTYTPWQIDYGTLNMRKVAGRTLLFTGMAVSGISCVAMIDQWDRHISNDIGGSIERIGLTVAAPFLVAGSLVPIAGPLLVGGVFMNGYGIAPLILGILVAAAQAVGLVFTLSAAFDTAAIEATKNGFAITGISADTTGTGGTFALSGRF